MTYFFVAKKYTESRQQSKILHIDKMNEPIECTMKKRKKTKRGITTKKNK